MSGKSLFDVLFSPISFIVGDKVGHVISGIALTAIGIATGQMWLAGIGLSMVSGSLLGPSTPKMPKTSPSDRLFATLDPTSPRKWVFGGTTALATDVRYQTYTGSDQDFYWQVIACASHEVQSIDEIWLDNERAWSGGTVQGRYAGYLTVTTRTLGTSANGVAIDGTWTTSCTLTGCAYVVLKFKLSDKSDKDRSPFAGGVTNRMTIRGKGAKVYDPRLDTTVSGGSGAQRAATQSTWAWDDNASRNPALQLLFFLLGWKINSKLALGMGLPAARIDLPSFITAANICDETITLNGGGTEPRYREDGVLSEGDDRQAVIESLCAQMNATLRDAGGKLAISVIHNDLASPVASFTEADILEGGKWVQTPPLSQSFNITRGRRIDPSDTALYQPVDFPEVSLTSPDGIDRIDTVEYQFVESNGQAQRLAKQRLQRNQYQGRYSFGGGERWWQTNVGDVVQLSHQAYGWANKLFRLVEQSIARTGQTHVTLLEENSAIYAWANDEIAAVTPGAPTIYDPLNSPTLQGVLNGRTGSGTNALSDPQFGSLWTFSAAGAVRKVADAASGYIKGNEPYFCELSPDTAAIRSATSELVPVSPSQRIYFKLDCQRGTTLGTGARLNMGHEWLQGDGTTLSITSPVEGTQQTPSSLTAGAAPASVFWSDVAPADAAFVRIKPYTPALASSSGTLRVEAPVISMVDLGGVASITYGADSASIKYDSSGTTAQTGELPRDLNYKLALGGVEQSVGVGWSYKVLTGSVNGFTSASGSQSMSGTGGGVLTISSLGADASTVEITGTCKGSTAKKTVSISKSYASSGTGGGGGSTTTVLASKTSGFTSINSTTFVDITGTLTAVMPAGKTTAYLTAPLNFTPTGNTNGSWTVELKWQRNISGTWTDQGTTPVASGGSDVIHDFEFNTTDRDPASITNSQTITGLTAGTSYDWRCVARLTSGTRQHDVAVTPPASVNVSA